MKSKRIEEIIELLREAKEQYNLLAYACIISSENKDLISAKNISKNKIESMVKLLNIFKYNIRIEYEEGKDDGFIERIEVKRRKLFR